MQKHLTVYIVALAILIMGTDVFAQQDQSPKLYMAFLDYDDFHIQLIDKCVSRFPDTSQSLRTAIAQWSRRNRPALQEVRLLLRDKTVRDGMAEADADARIAQARTDVTQFMTKGLDSAPESHVKSWCFGEYAKQLSSPSMDYVVFLEQLKAELKR